MLLIDYRGLFWVHVQNNHKPSFESNSILLEFWSILLVQHFGLLNVFSSFFLDPKIIFHNYWCCCEIVLWKSVESQPNIDIQNVVPHGESHGIGLQGPFDSVTKHLHVCDPALGFEFLHQIQIHYDMNFDPAMPIKKLQMLALTMVSNEQKVVLFI